MFTHVFTAVMCKQFINYISRVSGSTAWHWLQGLQQGRHCCRAPRATRMAPIDFPCCSSRRGPRDRTSPQKRRDGKFEGGERLPGVVAKSQVASPPLSLAHRTDSRLTIDSRQERSTFERPYAAGDYSAFVEYAASPPASPNGERERQVSVSAVCDDVDTPGPRQGTGIQFE